MKRNHTELPRRKNHISVRKGLLLYILFAFVLVGSLLFSLKALGLLLFVALL